MCTNFQPFYTYDYDNLGFHQLLSILVIPSPVRISEGKISNGQLFVAPLVPHTALAGYFAARLQFATREQLRKEYTCVCQGLEAACGNVMNFPP